jgi:hypothetical protein
MPHPCDISLIMRVGRMALRVQVGANRGVFTPYQQCATGRGTRCAAALNRAGGPRLSCGAATGLAARSVRASRLEVLLVRKNPGRASSGLDDLVRVSPPRWRRRTKVAPLAGGGDAGLLSDLFGTGKRSPIPCRWLGAVLWPVGHQSKEPQSPRAAASVGHQGRARRRWRHPLLKSVPSVKSVVKAGA